MNPQAKNTNNLAVQLFQAIGRFIQGGLASVGSQRSRSYYSDSQYSVSGNRNELGLEIREVPIREQVLALKLLAIRKKCPEVATAARVIKGDLFSSADGDMVGYTVADTLIDETPINPRVKEILKALIDRAINGQQLLEHADRAIFLGDAFASIVFDSSVRRIEKLLAIPTFEVFRIEENDGTLRRFEQRATLYDSSPIVFEPYQMVHFRYDKDHLYGRAITMSILDDWERLWRGKEDLSKASRSIGVNPDVHEMPPGTDEKYKDLYAKSLEQKESTGIVIRHFIRNGAKIGKLSQNDPNLDALINSNDHWRQVIVTTLGIPPYLGGLPAIGARDISGQPSMAYARFVASLRSMMSVGIRQLCDLELALNGLDPKDPRNAYRLVFPKVFVDQTQQDTTNQVDQVETSKPTKVKGKKDKGGKKNADNQQESRYFSNYRGNSYEYY